MASIMCPQRMTTNVCDTSALGVLGWKSVAELDQEHKGAISDISNIRFSWPEHEGEIFSGNAAMRKRRGHQQEANTGNVAKCRTYERDTRLVMSLQSQIASTKMSFQCHVEHQTLGIVWRGQQGSISYSPIPNF